jgi:hypothetical protein
MMDDEEILEYTKKVYPKEHELIVRSMINYYTLKLKEGKDEREEMHQHKIYEGVIDLFQILSKKIGDEMNEDSNLIFESLQSIHIKT